MPHKLTPKKKLHFNEHLTIMNRNETKNTKTSDEFNTHNGHFQCEIPFDVMNNQVTLNEMMLLESSI